MTVSLKHAFTSNVADSSDASLVQPSNWNAEHTLTAAANTLLGAVTAGSVTEITCTSAGRALLDDADAAAQRATLAAAGTGVTNTFTASQILSGIVPELIYSETDTGTSIRTLVDASAWDIRKNDYSVLFSVNNANGNTLLSPASGDVGIGTSSPASALHVNRSAGTASYLRVSSGSNVSLFGHGAGGELVTGSFVSQPYLFYTNSSERMRISASGNVGIGTSNPGFPLDVQCDSSAFGLRLLGRSDNISVLRFVSNDGATTYGQFDVRSYEFKFNAVANIPISFSTNNTERMRITAAGDVGIGTSSPLSSSGYGWLTINGTTFGAIASFTTNGTENFRIQAINGNAVYLNTLSNVPMLLNTNNLERMRIREDGNVGIGNSGFSYSKLTVKNDRAASFYSLVVDNYNGVNFENSFVLQYDSTGTQSLGNYQAANLAFLTNNLERMRIASGGQVLISTTTIGSGRLNISGYQDGTFYGIFMTPTANAATAMAFTNAAGTIVGVIATNATATAFTSTSDYRLKSDICPIGYPIKRLSSLKPVNFKWNSTGERMDGFLAHEVQDIVPEAVNGEKDAVDKDGKPVYQSIDQAKLMPLVVSALQETINRLELLEAKYEKNQRQELQ